MRRRIVGFAEIVSEEGEGITALAAYLEATGLSQEELAQATSKHRNTIGSLVAGGVCRKATSVEIARYTGIPDELLYTAERRAAWRFEVAGHRVKVVDDISHTTAAA